jgi:hypothetical protein
MPVFVFRLDKRRWKAFLLGSVLSVLLTADLSMLILSPSFCSGVLPTRSSLRPSLPLHPLVHCGLSSVAKRQCHLRLRRCPRSSQGLPCWLISRSQDIHLHGQRTSDTNFAQHAQLRPGQDGGLVRISSSGRAGSLQNGRRQVSLSSNYSIPDEATEVVNVWSLGSTLLTNASRAAHRSAPMCLAQPPPRRIGNSRRRRNRDRGSTRSSKARGIRTLSRQLDYESVIKGHPKACANRKSWRGGGGNITRDS